MSLSPLPFGAYPGVVLDFAPKSRGTRLLSGPIGFLLFVVLIGTSTIDRIESTPNRPPTPAFIAIP